LNQPPLLLHALIKRGLRIRRQEGEDHGKELRPDGKGHGLFKDRRIVLIKTKDERGPDRDAVPVKGIDDLPIRRRIILIFMGLDQIVSGKRFKSDEKADASAFHQE